MKKILVISPQVIVPPSDGGKKCMYYQIEALLSFDLEVSLVMGNDDNNGIKDENKGYLSKLKQVLIFPRINKKITKSKFGFKIYEILKWIISLKPRQAQTISSERNKKKVTEYIINNNINYIVLETPFAFEYIEINRIRNKNIKIITIEHNVEYLFRKDCLEKLGIFATWEIYLTKKYEKKVLKNSNLVIAISPKDKEILKRKFKINNIKYISTFWNKTEEKWKNSETNYIIFSGSLNFYPNYHGIKWFLENVFSKFIIKYPNIKLKITGNVDLKIKNELIKYKNIEFTGFLSDEEMQSILTNCLFMVIPIIKGSGIKIKLLEALSMGIPVIATKHCFEGIPYEWNIEEPYLVSQNKDDFIDKMYLLVQSKKYREEISKEANEFFYKTYENEKIKTEKIYDILNGV